MNAIYKYSHYSSPCSAQQLAVVRGCCRKCLFFALGSWKFIIWIYLWIGPTAFGLYMFIVYTSERVRAKESENGAHCMYYFLSLCHSHPIFAGIVSDWLVVRVHEKCVHIRIDRSRTISVFFYFEIHAKIKYSVDGTTCIDFEIEH